MLEPVHVHAGAYTNAFHLLRPRGGQKKGPPSLWPLIYNWLILNNNSSKTWTDGLFMVDPRDAGLLRPPIGRTSDP